MATFTLTVTASKIDVTAGTGNLEDLYDDLYTEAGGAETYMTQVGQVYEIQGNRELELSSGVSLTMVEDDELDWDLSGNLSPGFDCADGSTFIVNPGCVLNFDVSNGNYSRWYIYGYTSLQGTEAKPILIKRYYDNRIYNKEGNTPHDWDWVEFQDPSSYSSSNFPLYFYNDSEVSLAHSFVNIKINNRTNSGYIVSFYPGDWSEVEFDNWSSEDTLFGINSYGANFKFSNSTFKQIYYYNLIRGNCASSPYVTAANATSPYLQEQPKITFENCTFEDNYNSAAAEYGFYLTYDVTIKFKDCTFQGVEDTMTYGAASRYASRFLWEGTNTFTNVTTDRVWIVTGTHLHTYSLDLTVNDNEGSPLENAHVTVRQKEGNEVWHFDTDSNGNIKDLFGDNPVFVYQEETSTSTYDIWSDGTGDLIHEITISHPDYQIDTREVAFSQDRTITAQLSNLEAGNTRIYGSSLYGSTIY